MLSKPVNGWTNVTLGGMELDASYVYDIPFCWLRACIHSLKYDLPLSLYADLEVSKAYITSYFARTHIIIEDEGYRLFVIEKINFTDIARMLIDDISACLDDWAEWYAMEDSEEDHERRKRELLQLLNETEAALAAYLSDKA